MQCRRGVRVDVDETAQKTVAHGKDTLRRWVRSSGQLKRKVTIGADQLVVVAHEKD